METMWVMALPIAPIWLMRWSVAAKRMSICCWWRVKLSSQAAKR